jgi:hypothetical protein
MSEPIGMGTIVQSPRMHGIFGTVVGVRPQRLHGLGRGYGEVEYNLRNGSLTSWIDERQIKPATLDDITEHYQNLMREQQRQMGELVDYVCTCADQDPWRGPVHTGDCPLAGFGEDDDEEEEG